MSTTSYNAWLHERLREPELAAGYLKAHFDKLNEPDGKQMLALALRDIAEANGVLPDIFKKDVQDE